MSVDHKLAELNQQITARQRYIESQEFLIEVLERDGHDVLEEEIALHKERSMLATEICLQFELMKTLTQVD